VQRAVELAHMMDDEEPFLPAPLRSYFLYGL
jgi:hypothetical protein